MVLLATPALAPPALPAFGCLAPPVCTFASEAALGGDDSGLQAFVWLKRGKLSTKSSGKEARAPQCQYL